MGRMDEQAVAPQHRSRTGTALVVGAYLVPLGLAITGLLLIHDVAIAVALAAIEVVCGGGSAYIIRSGRRDPAPPRDPLQPRLAPAKPRAPGQVLDRGLLQVAGGMAGVVLVIIIVISVAAAQHH